MRVNKSTCSLVSVRLHKKQAYTELLGIVRPDEIITYRNFFSKKDLVYWNE